MVENHPKMRLKHDVRMNYEVKMIEPEPAIVTTVSGVAVLV